MRHGGKVVMTGLIRVNARSYFYASCETEQSAPAK
jgi:hypothetical protein